MTDMRIVVIALLLAGATAAADTEINRCLLADGTIAFQEMPCPEPAATVDDDSGESASETSSADDDSFEFVNPFDEQVAVTTGTESALPEPVSDDRAECEKTTREAIDAIDRELAVARESAQERLPELLALTKQLRACKQL